MGRHPPPSGDLHLAVARGGCLDGSVRPVPGGKLPVHALAIATLDLHPHRLCADETGLAGAVDAPTVGKIVLGVGVFRAGEVILVRWMFPSIELVPHATTHADSVLFSVCVCILLAMLLEMPGRRTLKLCLFLLPVFVWAMR